LLLLQGEAGEDAVLEEVDVGLACGWEDELAEELDEAGLKEGDEEGLEWGAGELVKS